MDTGDARTYMICPVCGMDVRTEITPFDGRHFHPVCYQRVYGQSTPCPSCDQLRGERERLRAALTDELAWLNERHDGWSAEGLERDRVAITARLDFTLRIKMIKDALDVQD